MVKITIHPFTHHQKQNLHSLSITKSIKNPKNPENHMNTMNVHPPSNPNRISWTQININSSNSCQYSSQTDQIRQQIHKIISNFRDSQRFFKESSSSNLCILPAIPTVRWSQERFQERRGEERSNSKLNKRRRKIRFETEQEKKRNTFICSKQRRNDHQKQTTKLYFKLLRSNLRIKQR